MAANGPAGAKLVAGLRALALAESVRVLSVGVYPNENDAGRVTDYRATTAIELLITNVDSVGLVIDRAVTIGLTSVDRVTFEADSTTAARHQALAQAFGKARADAQALSKAAGHELGVLLGVSANEDQWRGAPLAFEEASVTTGRSSAEFGNAQAGVIRIGPTPRSIRVTAAVTGRWALK